MRIAEDVIDDGAAPRPFDGDGDVQADQFERIAVADVDAGEVGRLASRFQTVGAFVGLDLRRRRFIPKRIAEDVIDRGAAPRPVDGDADVQAHEFQRIAVADIDSRKRRPAKISLPDSRGFRRFGLRRRRFIPKAIHHGSVGYSGTTNLIRIERVSTVVGINVYWRRVQERGNRQFAILLVFRLCNECLRIAGIRLQWNQNAAEFAHEQCAAHEADAQPQHQKTTICQRAQGMTASLMKREPQEKGDDSHDAVTSVDGIAEQNLR